MSSLDLVSVFIEADVEGCRGLYAFLLNFKSLLYGKLYLLTTIRRFKYLFRVIQNWNLGVVFKQNLRFGLFSDSCS